MAVVASAFLAAAVVMSVRQPGRATAAERSGTSAPARPLPVAPDHLSPGPAESWRDSFGDGWPDRARLATAADREHFTRWLTYLAESLYYQPAPQAKEEVHDCAALIRYAYRNALLAHTAEWRRAQGLRVEPGFASITAFRYADWPLGHNLFRTAPGPLALGDVASGAFQEFADAETLMRFNSFPVSRDLGAARAGDLLFFLQPEQAEPYHAMLFVGRSHFQPQGNDWIVYHTGDVDGRAGAIRHVQASVLAGHPEPRWRPLAANPRFLGVYRFNLLR